MKRTAALFLALILLAFALPAPAETFVRVDRDDPEAWKGELDNVRFLTEEGMSGSAQFSADQFHSLAGRLREQSGNVWIVDCRLESHGFVNGIAVSWCDENNGANLGRTAEEIEAGLRPALVVAVPVGFVNVVESKERLFAVCERCGVPAIAAMGRKGGSSVAAAVCNALIYTAADLLDPSARGWQG